jgi:hypothetical protein
MKQILAILSLAVLALFAGCSTTATSGTTSIKMDKNTTQSFGSAGEVSAVVVTTATDGTTAALTPVKWGLNGVNYETELTGVSTSETATLATPADLAVGSYPVTAAVGGATASAMLKVVDYPTVFNETATAAAPTVKAAFKLTTYYVIKNNPELADTFSISASTVQVILCASDPTTAGFKAAIKLAYPDLSDTDAELIATALEAGYASAASTWKSETGSMLSLSQLWSDSEYAAGINTLTTAALTGVSEGVTMATSSTD